MKLFYYFKAGHGYSNDVTNIAFRAGLPQIQEGQERIIGYYSKRASLDDRLVRDT